MKRACADIAALPGDLEVSVNVSRGPTRRRRVWRPTCARRWSERPARERLRIEITESALLREKPAVADQITRAARTWASAFRSTISAPAIPVSRYLENLSDRHVEDRSALCAPSSAHAPEAAATLRAIVDLARSYGMKTVAEGVETAGASCARLAGTRLRARAGLFARPSRAVAHA